MLVDVYKVDFGFYIDVTDTSYTSEASRRNNKIDWKPLLVYAHPEYLYAEDILSNKEKTIWQIKYKNKSLMQLQGKTALPMNFDGFLNTDVYTADEEIKDKTSGYGRLIFSNDTMTVAGYLCKQAVIRYWTKEGWVDTKEGETSIWYCPQLPRFYLPGYDYLQKIPGMALLILDDLAYGERKGIEAKAVVKLKKTVSFFDVPKGTFVMYPPSIK